MSVSGIQGSTVDYASQVAQISRSQPQQTAVNGTSSDRDGDGDGGGGARISRRGRFLAQLRDLQQTDPAKAKQLLTDLAQKIRSESSQGQDPKRLQFADKLEQAAQTGNIDDLFPQRGGGQAGGRASTAGVGGNAGGSTGATNSVIGAYTQSAVTRSS